MTGSGGCITSKYTFRPQQNSGNAIRNCRPAESGEKEADLPPLSWKSNHLSSIRHGPSPSFAAPLLIAISCYWHCGATCRPCRLHSHAGCRQVLPPSQNVPPTAMHGPEMTRCHHLATCPMARSLERSTGIATLFPPVLFSESSH